MQLDEEANERSLLESEIMKLKGQLDGSDLHQVVGAQIEAKPQYPDAFAGENGRRKTRYDMQMEMLMMKKR